MSWARSRCGSGAPAAAPRPLPGRGRPTPPPVWPGVKRGARAGATRSPASAAGPALLPPTRFPSPRGSLPKRVRQADLFRATIQGLSVGRCGRFSGPGPSEEQLAWLQGAHAAGGVTTPVRCRRRGCAGLTPAPHCKTLSVAADRAVSSPAVFPGLCAPRLVRVQGLARSSRRSAVISEDYPARAFW